MADKDTPNRAANKDKADRGRSNNDEQVRDNEDIER